MKKLLALALLFVNLAAQAQGWVLRTPLKENSTIKTIRCTADNGIVTLDVATNQNALYISDNNGNSWRRNTLPVVYDMFMLDDNNGFMVTNGNLMKTNDRFASTSSYALGSTGFRKVYFYSTSVGYCADLTGRLIKTTDGGVNWQQITTGATSPIRDIYFVSDNVGFLATDDGEILKSTDQGITWTIIENSGTLPLNRILFLNENLGFVAGSGVVKKTTDGGLTWTTKTIATVAFDLKLWNNKLLICGSSGKLYMSSDQGESWQLCNTPFTLKTYHSIGVQNGAVIVCQEGMLLVSTDLLGWTVLLDGMNRSKLRSITFADSNRGLVAGSGDYYSVIYSTSDGGNTWKKELTDSGNSIYHRYYAVHMNSTGNGISIGHDNTPLWRTSNYGDTWTGPPNGAFTTEGYTTCWKKENQDMVIGVANTIVRWGASTGWARITINSSGIFSTAIDFLNDNLGVVGCSQGQVLKTTDGGITWTNCNYPGFESIRKVQILSENLIFADNYKSTDGGLTWQAINTSGTVMECHFFNSMAGYGVNALKQVFKTVNGGQSWVRISSNGLTFSEFYFNSVYFSANKIIGVHNNSDIYVLSIQNPLTADEIKGTETISLQVYPNPSKSIINISCKSDVKSLQLFDINGRLLKAQENSGKQSAIDISEYAKGIYLLKVTTEYGNHSEKIVKE